MSDTQQLSLLDRDLVTKEIQHVTVTEDRTYALYSLLQELYSYMQTAEYDSLDTSPILESLASYYERVLAQLLEDNTAEQEIIDDLISLIDNITTYSRISLATFHNELRGVLLSLSKICYQYKALIEYTGLYQDIINYTGTVSDDQTAHYEVYNEFVKNVYETYLTVLMEAIDAIAEHDNSDERLSLYTFFLQMDESLVGNNVDTQVIVDLLIAVQNSRLYRSRTETMLALKDSFSIINTITILWYFININYKVAGLGLPSIATNWEDILDSDDLESIEKLVGDISDYADSASSMATEASSILATMKNVAYQAINKNSIQSYADLLDFINNLVAKASAWLDSLNITITYEALQAFLNKLESLAQRLSAWLNDLANAEIFETINNIISLINATTETIRNVMCLVNQALCLVASILNWQTTILTPIVNQFTNLVNSLATDVSTTVSSITSTLVSPIADAIRTLVYETARTKLKAKAASAATAIGQDVSAISTVSSVIDEVIDSALGGSNSSILSYLTTTATSEIENVYNSIISAISTTSTTNCSPITTSTITAPNLAISVKLPSLSSINLDISC